MDATRTRLSFAGDWLMAAAFLVGTLVVAVLIVRGLRSTPAAQSTYRLTSAAVPADAVSVPTLTLGEGRELRVGDGAADALARLGPQMTLLSKVTELGPLGEREVRAYELAGIRFILVLEPFERAGAPRVAGIYLQ